MRSWVITKLLYAGHVRWPRHQSYGNIVGYQANPPRRPVLWFAQGGYTVLGCDTNQAEAQAISGDGQITVGHSVGQAVTGAYVWQSPGCTRASRRWKRAVAVARAVNNDGSILGGTSGIGQLSAPVRWLGISGQRQIQRLDDRQGTVHGGNSAGDLAGYVAVPCTAVDAQQGACQKAVLWYAGGGSRDLGTLGGTHSWATDVNSVGEAVGAAGRLPGETTQAISGHSRWGC